MIFKVVILGMTSHKMKNNQNFPLSSDEHCYLKQFLKGAIVKEILLFKVINSF